jgi:hypothetical protein
MHALLCGRCEDAERIDLLGRLTRDAALRDLLAEMIHTQQRARTAYGYPPVGKDLPAGPAASELVGRVSDAIRARRVSRRATWRRAFWRVAVGAVVAASVLLAWDVQRTNVLLRRELSKSGGGTHQAGPRLAIGRVQPAELQRFMTIWSEVAGDDAGGEGRPWILMTGQSGQFGYIGGPSPSGEARPIVVRVLLATADGEVLEKSNLLLPRGRTGRLTLADAGTLWDMPLGLEVDSSGSEATVGLRVGRGGRDVAGITGRVHVGSEAEEIGRLKVAGKDLRVIVHALPLGNGPVS